MRVNDSQKSAIVFSGTSAKMNRRQLLKSAGFWLAASCGLAVGTGIYSTLFERHWFQVKEVTIHLPRLPKAYDGVRIIHISDLHLGHYLEVKDAIPLVEEIRRLDPSLICFTGDLVDEDARYAGQAVDLLSSLAAPLGKYAVLGNHDYIAGAEEVSESLERAGFAVLTNRAEKVVLQGASLYLAGIADPLRGQPDLAQALAGIPADGCTILLAHAPDYADEAAAFSVDLQLSGHTHGGQVRLPFIGHLLTPRMGKKYPDGLQRVAGGTLQVYTNRGIGTTILPIRFFCRPEITVLTLRTVEA